MIISFYTPSDNTDLSRGYGAAGFGIVTSLQAAGNTVPFDDPTAPVQISFCNPYGYKFHPGQYKIGMTPWESTELPAGWQERMNACDEIWATSSWVAKVYKNAGVTVPIYVFDHGIDPVWQPIARHGSDVVRFLHVGEPALRKGGQMAVDAFRAAFGDRTDVHLHMKCYDAHWLRAWDGINGKFAMPHEVYNNVTIQTRNVSKSGLVELYVEHDVMVYPSYGEGFGLIPLQALATGMPVICTDDWAPYRHLLGPLSINGRYDRSIWSVHPGNVYYPNYEMLVQAYKFASENLEWLRDYYQSQAYKVHRDYDWKTLAIAATEHLQEVFTTKR